MEKPIKNSPTILWDCFLQPIIIKMAIMPASGASTSGLNIIKK